MIWCSTSGAISGANPKDLRYSTPLSLRRSHAIPQRKAAVARVRPGGASPLRKGPNWRSVISVSVSPAPAHTGQQPAEQQPAASPSPTRERRRGTSSMLMRSSRLGSAPARAGTIRSDRKSATPPPRPRSARRWTAPSPRARRSQDYACPAQPAKADRSGQRP